MERGSHDAVKPVDGPKRIAKVREALDLQPAMDAH
jgi:hypothetical protein